MEYEVRFKVCEKLYIKDPESSEIGRSIIKNAIELIHSIGFEHFTFKKLAIKTQTTEASIYRYFSSKHKLLVYILNWYWSYLEWISKIKLAEIEIPTDKVKKLLSIITHQDPQEENQLGVEMSIIHAIVISESSKSYLVKNIDEINGHHVFQPLKDFCDFCALVFSTINPAFPYPHSLASTLLEIAHSQGYFVEHLPKLTDNFQLKTPPNKYVLDYLEFLTNQLLSYQHH